VGYLTFDEEGLIINNPVASYRVLKIEKRQLPEVLFW